MSLKRFFILSVLSFFAMSIFSCNEEEEKTNVKFEWDYVKRKLQVQDGDTSWVIESSEKYVVDEYYIVKDSNMMQIYGYTTNDDSIKIGLVNHTVIPADPTDPTSPGNPSQQVTVGEYNLAGQYTYSLIFFNQSQPLLATSGFVNVSYLNSRIEMDFYSTLANGYNIENGVAENLDLALAPIDSLE